jgi:hypothetical protein
MVSVVVTSEPFSDSAVPGPVHSVHVPPGRRICHTGFFGAGMPDATALKVAADPAGTARFSGWTWITGRSGTSSSTGRLSAVPTTFVATARNLRPL